MLRPDCGRLRKNCVHALIEVFMRVTDAIETRRLLGALAPDA